MSVVDILAPFFVFWVFQTMNSLYGTWTFQTPQKFSEELRDKSLASHDYLLNASSQSWKGGMHDVMGFHFIPSWRSGNSNAVKDSMIIKVIGLIVMMFVAIFFVSIVLPGIPFFGDGLKNVLGPFYLIVRTLVFMLILRAILAFMFNANEIYKWKDLVANEALSNVVEALQGASASSPVADAWKERYAAWKEGVKNNVPETLLPKLPSKATALEALLAGKDQKAIRDIKQQIAQMKAQFMTNPELLEVHRTAFTNSLSPSTNIINWAWEKISVSDHATFIVVLLITYGYIIITSSTLGMGYYIGVQQPTDNGLRHFCAASIITCVIAIVYILGVWLTWVIGKKAALGLALEFLKSYPDTQLPAMFSWLGRRQTANLDVTTLSSFSIKSSFTFLSHNMLYPIVIACSLSVAVVATFVIWKEHEVKRKATLALLLDPSNNKDEDDDEDPMETLQDRMRAYAAAFKFALYILSAVFITLVQLGWMFELGDIVLVLVCVIVFVLATHLLFR